ncbi:MAG: nucleotide exchange factor GrpE [Armatimonadota bacterium]|nr:nucleotide exchange factor GrpE [Armatimonadota bacterium]
MAEKAKKIRITSPEDDHDASDVSFEASDAVPAVLYDEEDRQPIDLDTPIDLEAALAGASQAADAAPSFDDAPAPAVSSKELDALKAQVAQANDEKLRALADLQNFRRRNADDRARLIRDANERLIKELLPVLDDFGLAVSAAETAQSYEQLIGGVKAILRKFEETLAKQGVIPIPAVGEPFDAEVHEAVMLDEDTGLPDETVTAELRRGYTLNDRVIRPAMVKVAKG